MGTWIEGGHLQAGLFGLAPAWWCLLVGLLLAVVMVLAILRYQRGGLAILPAKPLGRGQLFFLFLLWTAVLAAFLRGSFTQRR